MANIRAIFRKTPPGRLREYMRARLDGFPEDFDWGLKSKSLADALAKKVSDHASSSKTAVPAELESIAAMADRDGWRSVEEICRGANIDVNACQGAHDAIMMLALHHREAFERAISASSFKRRNGGRDWSAFEISNVPDGRLIADKSARAHFVKEALSILEIPSNRRSEADWYQAIRRDPITGADSTVTQATVYVEERPEGALAFGEGDSVELTIVPRVGELGFSFDPVERIVEVCASGGKAQRGKYAKAFSRCFFGEESEPVESPLREINFARIQSEADFEIDPADRIERYEFSELSFYSQGGGFAKFERRDETETVFEFINRRFHGASPLSESGWKLFAATLRITRSPPDGRGRRKVLTIDLKSPNRTTLRNKTEEDRIFVTELLTRWGIFTPVIRDEPLVERD